MTGEHTHGWVRPSADGTRAPCGGPARCKVCRAEFAAVHGRDFGSELFDSFAPPREAYRTLLADPPWLERGGGASRRGADRHYPLLDVVGIVEAIRGSGYFRPAEDAHLWLWVTDNFLAEGLEVMRRLGFAYVRTAVWVKAQTEAELAAGGAAIGLGQYLRGSHELMLLGVRGSGMSPSVRTEHRDVRSVIYGRRGRHSAKPREAYRLIERVSLGPRIEFFARSRRRGWQSWGNEVGE